MSIILIDELRPFHTIVRLWNFFSLVSKGKPAYNVDNNNVYRLRNINLRGVPPQKKKKPTKNKNKQTHNPWQNYTAIKKLNRNTDWKEEHLNEDHIISIFIWGRQHTQTSKKGIKCTWTNIYRKLFSSLKCLTYICHPAFQWTETKSPQKTQQMTKHTSTLTHTNTHMHI